METMEIDVRTPAERKRDEKHRAICQAYLNLSSQYPNYKPYRIMAALARQFGMTTPGIKNVLEAKGLYGTK